MREIALIIHFIGLAMGLGTPIAFMILGIANAQLNKQDGHDFRLKTLAISRMGQFGLALLVISGLYLMTPYWSVLSLKPILIVKLLLVTILITLIFLLSLAGSKAKKGDAEAQFKKIELLGKLSLITALSIVIIAVLIFN